MRYTRPLLRSSGSSTALKQLNLPSAPMRLSEMMVPVNARLLLQATSWEPGSLNKGPCVTQKK